MLNERRPNCSGWIEIFKRTTDRMAVCRVMLALVLSVSAISNNVQKTIEIGSAQASVVAAKMVATTPPRMNGLRRPQEIRDRSLMTPRIG